MVNVLLVIYVYSEHTVLLLLTIALADLVILESSVLMDPMKVGF